MMMIYFAQFIEEGISERVTRTFGGVGNQDEEDLDFGEEDSDEDVHLGSGEELDDSEDELKDLERFDDEGPNYSIFNPIVDFKGKIKLSLGLKFPSIKAFRKALRHHAIESGYNYYYLHNGSSRVTIYCAKKCSCPMKKARIVCSCKKRKKCPFKVLCRKLKREETYQIKTYKPKHNCGHQHKNPKITTKYLVERYLDDFGDHSN